jgi:surfeit locus 1 family protein
LENETRNPPPAPRRPRWIPVTAAILGVALTASAGTWQWTKGSRKQALQARYDRGAADAPIHLGASPVSAEAVALHRVEASGEYVPQATVLLDNRIRAGVAGYHVITPLRIEGSSIHVLVNRGWVAAGPDRGRLPLVATPPGKVTVRGMAVVPGRFLELGKTDDEGPVWQNLTIERFRAGRKLDVQPVVIEQTDAADDGLARDWPRPDFGIAKHYGYAAQWFLFCGLIIFLFLFFHVRKTRSEENAPHAPAAGRD